MLPATLPATSSRAPTDFLMSPTVLTSTISRPATASATTRPITSATAQASWLVKAANANHLPTATLRSARAECRIRTPESLIRPIPASPSVCARTFSTPVHGGPRLGGDLPRQHHDRDHDRRRHRGHDDPEHEPDVPTGGSTDHQRQVTPPVSFYVYVGSVRVAPGLRLAAAHAPSARRRRAACIPPTPLIGDRTASLRRPLPRPARTAPPTEARPPASPPPRAR